MSADLPATEVELCCPQCGYDLRGAMGDSIRCPECGSEHQRSALAGSRIPWMRRHEVGRLRAWWQTCWSALFRPGDFAASLNAPLPYADARRFWLICLAAIAPMAMLAVVASYETPRIGSPFATLTAPSLYNNFVWPWVLGMEHLALPTIYMLLALPLLSGSMSYLFQIVPMERRRQDRAAALGLYAAGALVSGLLASLTCLLFLLAIAAAIIPSDLGVVVTPGLLVLLLGPVVCWWIAILLIYRRVCHAGIVRTLAAAGAIVLISVVALLISFGLLPFLGGMARILVEFFD